MTHSTLLSLLDPTMAALTGFVFGLVYFATLKRSVTLLASASGWFGSLAPTLARIAAAAGFLGIAAKLGTACLLAALLGFLLARSVALHVAMRSA